MARGANPRTGIVTPGVHSSSNSFDENQELSARGIALPAKWRQRGNQWISLEFGQPTPVPTPTSETGHVDPSIRTPPKLTAGKLIRGRTPPLPPPKSPPEPPPKDEDAMTPTGVPGSFPKTPSANHTVRTPNVSKVPEIKRKAIGSPMKSDGKDLGTIGSTSEGPYRHQTFLGLREDGMRSSSAPMPHKPDPFSPADIGVQFRHISTNDNPGMSAVLQSHSSSPFLEQPARHASANVCPPERIEKDLPCLPTNSGPSQYPPIVNPVQIHSKLAHEDMLTNLIIPQDLASRVPLQSSNTGNPRDRGLHGPRDMGQNRPGMRTSRPREPTVLSHPIEHAKGGRPMDIPVYDNPPPPGREPLEPRSHLAPLANPMMRQQHRQIPVNFDDILGTSMNMSMNTFTTTHTNTVPMVEPIAVRRTRQRNINGAVPVPMRRNMHGPPLMGRAGPAHGLRGNMNMNMSMSSSDLLGGQTAMPYIRRHNIMRPSMPNRTEAMHTIPTIDPRGHGPRLPSHIEHSMWPPYPRSPTGMTTTHSMPEFRPRANLLPPQMLSSQEPGMNRPTVVHPTTREASLDRPAPQETCTTQSASPESGLSRRCSRCTYGFVQGPQNQLDGTASTTTAAPKPAALLPSCVEEHHDETCVDTQSIEVVKKEATVVDQDETKENEHHSSTEILVTTVRKAPACPTAQSDAARKSISPVDLATAIPGQTRPILGWRQESRDAPIPILDDEKDHSACCPQCCREQDCHDGCLGHLSPSPSPVKRVRSTERLLNFRKDSITSLEGQPLTPLSERVKKLGVVKSALKKSLRTPSPTKSSRLPFLSSRINDVDEVEMMFSELSSGPASPGTFWGGSPRSSSTTAAQVAINRLSRSNSTGSASVGATAAAKTAITMHPLDGNRKPAVLVKRRRGSNKNIANPERDTRKVTPNEGRRVTSHQDQVEGLNDSTNDSTSPRSTRSRRISNTSITTLEVPMPKITSVTSGVSAVCEIALVPFEASRMWLRNHPTVSNGGWDVINRGLQMLSVVVCTTEACWRIVFVYSKTGKLRLPKIVETSTRDTDDGKELKTVQVVQMTPAGFMWDCVRSAAYVLILLALLVLVVRIVRWALGVVRFVLAVVNGVAWVGKVLLGGGILW